MLEWLKSLFRPGGTDVQYERQPDTGPNVVPAGPPTGRMPSVAPVDDPFAEVQADDTS